MTLSVRRARMGSTSLMKDKNNAYPVQTMLLALMVTK